MNVRDQIQSSLERIKGEPLWHAHRAASLQVFWLGPPVPEVTFDGNDVTVGQYSLHVQCAWRIRNRVRIIVGSRDLYLDWAERAAENSPDEADTSRDKELKRLIEDRTRPLRVKDIQADHIAGLTLVLEEGLRLEVFPDAAGQDPHAENWRCFEQGSNRHLVARGSTVLFE